MQTDTTLAARGHASVRRRGLLTWLFDLDGAYRSRQALARLNEAQLADIGLTPEDVDRELGRPAWNVPHYWRR